MMDMVKNPRYYYSDYRDLDAHDRRWTEADTCMDMIRQLMQGIDDTLDQMTDASYAQDRAQYQELDYKLSAMIKEEQERADYLVEIAQMVRDSTRVEEDAE